MAAEPIIEPILEHVAPDLQLVPDWAPAPDPPVPLGPLGQKLQWSDVFDWVSSNWRAPFGSGRAIDQVQFGDVQNMIDSAAGEIIKAMSGFLDQNAAMTVQAASLLEDAIDNAVSSETFDFQQLSQRLDSIEATQNFIAQYVVPDLNAKIQKAEAFAFGAAVAAQQNAEQWATQNIFDPVYSELLKVQPAIDASIKANNPTILAAAQSQVNILHDLIAPTIAGAAALATQANSWIDDCGEPMCEAMGPKTDLGKLLKALSIATDLALLAELTNLNESRLAALIQSVVGHIGSIVSDFESMFQEGGDTVGDIIKSFV